MACNTPTVALKQLRRSSCSLAAARGDKASNALPYKIAAARDVHPNGACRGDAAGLFVMGEATRHLPPEVKDANPDIPCVYMAAVRNRIAHGYFGLDDLLLYETIAGGLKPLLPRLEALAREHKVGE